ncbi:MAG TPA: Spy/CpxP family protein refolding chaperone [Pyrinomonadaceae bacterium]|nr:Spy/CpxP family protein refolding chaperone [Pyrinomonadaceae bacterium]
MKKLGRFKMLAIATLSAIALAASIAVAQTVTTNQDNGQGARKEWRGRRGDHKGMRGMRAGGFFRGLNLTEDQKAKMKQIRESFAATNKPLHEQLRAKRQELRQASEGGTFNEALATQKLTEIAPLEAKVMAARSSMHQEMLSVLTAEQKAQLEQSKAQFKQRRAERKGTDQQ